MATSKYTCELCKKTFNQKIDFTRHKNKKAPCISIAEIQQISQTAVVKDDMKSKLISVFKGCLNVLRDNEGLTGEKALRNMSYLLILKLIEKHLGGEIDIDNYNYDFSYLDDSLVEAHRKKLLEVARYSKLVAEKEDNITNIIKYLWDDILSVHPSTKNIFLKDKCFDIRRQATYKKLFDKLNELPETEYDILGNAYEEVIQGSMTGNVLGQFFTQPLIKKMMVNLIDPQIHPDGRIESCGDPTMGTGGFLITYLKYILRQADIKGIKPDWNFIKMEGLYGKELEPDTYQLAVSNMLISSGHMFEGLECGDSIREPITRKFDNILANPPFGIKNLMYDNFNYLLKNEYIPIKLDNAASLFIQIVIYMLKHNGKCAIVLPTGRELFSKTDAALIAIREYLMKTCDLKEVIYLPSGIFTYTPIKTCVFFFIKKKEGTDVLKVGIKMSKAQRETGRTYEFSKTLQTSVVKFYDYNPYEDVKNLLAEVPAEQIANNSYSLNYTEYIKDEKRQFEENIVVKLLGEICDINYGTRIIKSKNINGIYPVYGSGRAMFSTNTFNREGYNILIGRFALSPDCVRFVNEKIFLNDSGLTVKPKTDILIHKYIGYYLLYIQNDIYQCARGTAQKNLDIDMFKSIKIPIPPIERQQEIVNYLDFIYEKANKTSNEKIAELKRLNAFCLSNQKMFGENVIRTLGEICDINYGTRIVKSKNIDGTYPVYGSGRAMFSTSSFNREGYNVLIGRFALSPDCVRFTNEKIFLNDSGLTVKPKIDILMHKYIGYHLFHNQSDIYECARGTAQKNIDIDMFKSIKIPIPSLEIQKEIIDCCEFNDALIKQLEGEIENNKRMASQFIMRAIKAPIEQVGEL